MLFIEMAIDFSNSFGFDSANSCHPNYNPSRQGRSQILTAIPCDFTRQNFCNIPGSAYPWRAVRRFVQENQGLIKRMYGDVRHISILRDEFKYSEINIEHVQLAKDRYSRDVFERPLKQAHNKASKNSIIQPVFLEPNFRSVSTTPRSLPSLLKTKVSIEELTSKAIESMGPTKLTEIADEISVTSFSKPILATQKELTETKNQKSKSRYSSKKTQIYVDWIKNKPECAVRWEGKENPALNSVYEAEPMLHSYKLSGDNIEIIQSPRLGLNTSLHIAGTSLAGGLLESNTSKEGEISSLTNPLKPELIVQDTITKKFNESERKENLIVDNDTTTTFLKIDKRKHIDLNLLNASKSSSNKLPLVLVETTNSLGKIQYTSNSSENDVPPITKPVLGANQLFQDTMKQESSSIMNIRGVNACPVKEEVVAPFWANNTRGEVLALLNLYPFEQYVHWEKCTHELKQMHCREGCRCEQQYRLHRLLAYDPHNECRGIFSDWFRFPSCCICKCYDIPTDFHGTSRSPRYDPEAQKHTFEAAEEIGKNENIEHATGKFYRPNVHVKLNAS